MRPTTELRDRARLRRAPKTAFRGIVTTSAAMVAAIVVGVSLSAGSFALWTDNSVSSSVSVVSGTAGLTATGPFTAASWTNLLPGETVRQPFTIENTGAVDLSVSGTAVTGSTDFEIRVVSGACPGTALGGASATASALPLGTLAAGASATACLEVALVTGAAQGSSSSWVLTVTGTQVP